MSRGGGDRGTVLMEFIDEEGSEEIVHWVQESDPTKPERICGEVDERPTEEKLKRKKNAEIDHSTDDSSA
jgi:hypothetical protein